MNCFCTITSHHEWKFSLPPIGSHLVKEKREIKDIELCRVSQPNSTEKKLKVMILKFTYTHCVIATLCPHPQIRWNLNPQIQKDWIWRQGLYGGRAKWGHVGRDLTSWTWCPKRKKPVPTSHAEGRLCEDTWYRNRGLTRNQSCQHPDLHFKPPELWEK